MLLNALCLSLGLLLNLVDFVSGCNMTAIKECIPILSQGTDIDMMNEGISAIPSAEQLKKMCGMLEEYDACYQPKAEACANDVVYTMTFGTMERTIDYLCLEGYEDILRHETCWNKTEVKDGTKQCHDKQNDDIQAMKSNRGDRSKMKERWCQILDNTTTCVETTIITHCGVAPACIMKTMFDRALVGLSSLMKCTQPQPCNVTSTTEQPYDSTAKENSTALKKADLTFTIFLYFLSKALNFSLNR